ncbi:MAG: hypothetical protein KAS78_02145 [Candidatus Pacebacteria bacterium]|nr:hypothetical protein [Candidatus Paceibacterota bacterium]
MNKEQEEEFNKLLPCIQPGCGNNGIIPEQDGEGDWQPAQCEYCYKVRFPIKAFINKLLKEERGRTLKIIDEIIGYGDTVEGGIAEGVLILVKSKIDKKDIN